MDNEQLTQWLSSYGAAWIARDPDASALLFSEEATYCESPFEKCLTGREAIRRYWLDVPRNQSHITFTSDVLALADGQGIVHWHATFIRVSNGVHVKLDGIMTIKLDDEGLCTEFQEWWIKHEALAEPGAYRQR